MQIEIRKLKPQDVNGFIELIGVFEEVFERQNFSMPAEAHITNVLSKSDFLVFVAIHQHKVIGGLTVYILHQYYSEKPLAYLYDLAVKKIYQRKGIGKKLITYMCTYCRENDFEEAFVQTYSEEEEAIKFYRSTRRLASEEQVVHFSYLFDDK